MRRAVVITTAACIGVWALARWVIFDYFQLGDTRVYEHASRMIDAGAVPYRDFDIEYPPLATGLFWLVGRVPGDYQLAFSMTMLACLVATALAALVAARQLGLSPARQWLAVGVVALTPVLLGTLVQTRYDLVLSALLGWMLVAGLADRFGWAWTLLAVAVAIKLVPILLVPALIMWHAHRRDRRSALTGAVALAVGVALTLGPFFAIAPHPTWRLFAYHLDRPLQIESLGSSIVHVAGLPFRSLNSYGSENVAGRVPDALATLSTLLLVACLVAIVAVLARGLRRRLSAAAELWVAATAATIVAAVTLGKVVSPQYLVWLLPATLLVAGSRGRVAAIVLPVAMVVTQLIFPLLYSDLVERGDPVPVGLLVARNALLVVMLWSVWPRRAVRRAAAADQPPELGGDPHSAMRPA
jgi:uncharacterized membrane protein